MNSTTIAIDVAKSVFEVAISEQPGQVRERKRLSREQFRQFLAERPAATILMEACGSAHHWARHAQAHGHQAVLVPPHVVRPYVLRNKTDRTDAKGLLEAFRNEDVHPVPVKSETQQALTALHRLRSTWLATRTARINTVRGLLREFGLPLPVGAHHVIPKVPLLLEDADSGVPGLLRPALAAAVQAIREIDARIRAVERQLEAAAAQALSVRQLRTIPGIGPLTATALVAAVGDVQRFPSARHFASYLGLTPREHSTGPRQRLGAISKRGDSHELLRAARVGVPGGGDRRGGPGCLVLSPNSASAPGQGLRGASLHGQASTRQGDVEHAHRTVGAAPLNEDRTLVQTFHGPGRAVLAFGNEHADGPAHPEHARSRHGHREGEKLLEAGILEPERIEACRELMCRGIGIMASLATEQITAIRGGRTHRSRRPS
jgi:transposase